MEQFYFVYLGDYCGYLIRFVYYNLNFTCQWRNNKMGSLFDRPRGYIVRLPYLRYVIIHFSLTIPLELAE